MNIGRKNTSLTAAQEKQVAVLYTHGHNVKEIMKEFKISAWKVYNTLDKENINRRVEEKNSKRYNVFSRLTDEDINNILRDVDYGLLSDEEIQVKYNLETEHTLREIKIKRPFLVKKQKDLSGLDLVDYD